MQSEHAANQINGRSNYLRHGASWVWLADNIHVLETRRFGFPSREMKVFGDGPEHGTRGARFPVATASFGIG
jgi:hypothetical protein